MIHLALLRAQARLEVTPVAPISRLRERYARTLIETPESFIL